MKIRLLAAMAAMAHLLSHQVLGGQYAGFVAAYSPGTGYATDFATGAGLTNATSALGEPSRVTPGQFGGPVDPFSPPYLGSQIVSIGAGGSLTVGFNSPLSNNAQNAFGLDFIMFGNAGFVITNGDFSGGGITDGSLFGGNSGESRVWVSADNATFYQLDPKRAPALDNLFPTDGSGAFEVPVNPALGGPAFDGMDLTGIRGQYAGSGGGRGYDIGWAIDSQGNPVSLPDVRFIRFDVVSGVAEIDGVSGVQAVPEPGTWTLLALGIAVMACRGTRKIDDGCRTQESI